MKNAEAEDLRSAKAAAILMVKGDDSLQTMSALDEATALVEWCFTTTTDIEPTASEVVRVAGRRAFYLATWKLPDSYGLAGQQCQWYPTFKEEDDVPHRLPDSAAPPDLGPEAQSTSEERGNTETL